MTNHFHLLLETPQTTLSSGMQTFEGDYAKAFNRRYRRVGHLFQGRFIGHLVEEETYFLTVARYIVLNPVDAKMVASAGQWPWSSYNATAGVARPPEWLEARRVLAKFHPEDHAAACREYRVFIAAGAGGLPDPFENAIAGVYLGSESFMERVRELTKQRTWTSNHSTGQRNAAVPTVDEVRNGVENVFSAPVNVRSWRSEKSRAAFALLARREAIASWPVIAKHLGMSATGARRMGMHAGVLERTDGGFRDRVAEVVMKINVCGMRA
jgi:hypothetical protein